MLNLKIQKSNILTPPYFNFIFDKMLATFTDADYNLLEQRFSSFEQAFKWGQRNRYKYKRHSKSFADDLLERKKYKFYIYGCDSHGAYCPNERKFEFQSTGEGKYEIHMFERGLHNITSSSIPKKRGIEPRLLDFIDYLCKDIRYAPKDIRNAVLRKAQAGEWGPTEDLIFPSIEQIKNRKKNLPVVDKKLPVDEVITSGHQNYKYVNSQPIFEQSLIHPPPSTSDFIWSSSVLSQNSNSKSCTTQESQLQPIFEQSLINPPPSTLSVFSKSSNYKTTLPEERVVPLTSTDPIDSRMSSSIPSSRTTFDDDSSSNLNPQRPKNEHSIINLSADDKYQKYVDSFISIVDTNDYTAEKKLLLANRVKEMLKRQFDFQFFSDIFNSYSPHERDNMIIHLQMLNCLKKASDKPYLKLKMPIFPETTPSPKRHKKTDFDDYKEYEDGDEITYHD